MNVKYYKLCFLHMQSIESEINDQSSPSNTLMKNVTAIHTDATLILSEIYI